MQVTLAEAQAKLPYLLSRVAKGEQVVVTEDGHAAAKLVAVEGATPSDPPLTDERWALLEALYGSARNRFGPDAARSADYLYDDYGLPA